ncbi:hypothetical protein BGLA2_420122 [Burkholderia gladioli]|nr:hypothetical protein BGLA2_420122 [Burkholderia gladioli]
MMRSLSLYVFTSAHPSPEVRTSIGPCDPSYRSNGRRRLNWSARKIYIPFGFRINIKKDIEQVYR